MTAEERVDLKIAIDLMRDLRAAVDAIPVQTRAAISDAMQLHVAERHAHDAEVVSGVQVLMDERHDAGALKAFCARYWRQLLAALAAATVILEVLGRVGVL